jgi:hypothetical protein
MMKKNMARFLCADHRQGDQAPSEQKVTTGNIMVGWEHPDD